jgi:hypothetical protein
MKNTNNRGRYGYKSDIDFPNFGSLKQRVEHFIKLEGREPTYRDFDSTGYLPSSRTIQRNWGGLKKVRADLGMKETDYTAGSVRTTTAKAIGERCAAYEKKIINKLFDLHHDSDKFTKTVVRHFAYQQWVPDEKYYANIACDVGITNRETDHVTLIDFFYPKDWDSFGGCVRSKKAKLKKHPISLYDCTHDVVFVCVNPEMDQDTIDNVYCVSNSPEITVQSLETFTKAWLN